jgi:hypothetical protein
VNTPLFESLLNTFYNSRRPPFHEFRSSFLLQTIQFDNAFEQGGRELGARLAGQHSLHEVAQTVSSACDNELGRWIAELPEAARCLKGLSHPKL